MDIQKILTKLRITELNEMQQHAAEAILGSDGDVVLLSPTGSGKTLAYLLPLVQLLDGTSDTVQALVITPGRELALQSDNVLKSMGCGLRSTACYGGRAAMDEHKVLKEVKPQNRRVRQMSGNGISGRDAETHQASAWTTTQNPAFCHQC